MKGLKMRKILKALRPGWKFWTTVALVAVVILADIISFGIYFQNDKLGHYRGKEVSFKASVSEVCLVTEQRQDCEAPPKKGQIASLSIRDGNILIVSLAITPGQDGRYQHGILSDNLDP
jgi:hypothetical protein